MIKGIHHIGISVADLSRSLEFYRDLLDMVVIVKPQPFGGELYDRILGLTGAQGRVAVVRRGTLELELFEFKQPTPTRKRQSCPVSDHGLSHFCIAVADIESTYKHLANAGVSFHCPPLTFGGGTKATYGRDIDGNVFELLETAE
jgi:catechol 2,3-dioxygenase-like lactoylglutathione lyase family enzyme